MFERFGRHARVAVVLAQEEARELEAREIRPEHLLLGILLGAGAGLREVLAGYGLTHDAVRTRLVADGPSGPSLDEDADALRSIGIDLTAVRESVSRTFGEGALDDAPPGASTRRRRRHVPFTRASKKVLELALREAVAHEDGGIDCEHLLLGILRGGDRYALSLITEHVFATQLRGSVIELLDEAA